MRQMDGSEIEHVTGTGFGCLLVRRSVLSRFGLSGDDKACWSFDVNIGVRVSRTGPAGSGSSVDPSTANTSSERSEPFELANASSIPPTKATFAQMRLLDEFP